MSDFRGRLREAFAKEQARLGDVADARQRLVRSAIAAPEVGHDRVPWAAGIAAVLLAAIVITSFVLVRAGIQARVVPATSPTPRASASPTPLNRELKVADSTPVILYHDTAKPDQVDGVTWDGNNNGKVSSPMAGTPNPSATLFATATEIRDRSGKLIAGGNFGAKSFAGTWADDGQHICLMAPLDHLGANGIPATLQLITPGQAPRDVAQVGNIYEQVNTYVAACSVQFDRAFVVQSIGQGLGTALVWMVKLSTGRILWTQDYRGHSSIVTPVASADCKYIAVNYGGQGPNGVTIYRADGTALTPVNDQPGQLNMTVEGFSWDGSLAVTTPVGGGPVTVIRWRDGSVVWRGPSAAGFDFSRSMPEPGGTGVAIGVTDPARFAQRTVDFYIIAPDGQVVVQINDIYW